MAEHVIETLTRHNGNKDSAARELQICIRSMDRYCKELSEKYPDFQYYARRVYESDNKKYSKGYEMPTNKERLAYADNPHLGSRR